MRPSQVLLDNIEEVKKLTKDCHIASLRLYGSVARNTDTDASDIDFLAIYERDANIFHHSEFVYRINALLGVECDIISNEILSLDGFSDMMEKSISLEDFIHKKYISIGYVSEEERDASKGDSLAWIINRICDTIGDCSYDTFKSDYKTYDALAYEFQLLGSIANNSNHKLINKYRTIYGIDLTHCSILSQLLLTTVYPEMLYQAAVYLKGKKEKK